MKCTPVGLIGVRAFNLRKPGSPAPGLGAASRLRMRMFRTDGTDGTEAIGASLTVAASGISVAIRVGSGVAMCTSGAITSGTCTSGAITSGTGTSIFATGAIGTAVIGVGSVGTFGAFAGSFLTAAGFAIVGGLVGAITVGAVGIVGTEGVGDPAVAIPAVFNPPLLMMVSTCSRWTGSKLLS